MWNVQRTRVKCSQVNIPVFVINYLIIVFPLFFDVFIGLYWFSMLAFWIRQTVAFAACFLETFVIDWLHATSNILSTLRY